MDFACIVLFLAMYYLKPQEWSPIFAKVRFAQITILASLITLFFREKSLKIADFFKTPHDWAVFAFIVWGIVSSPERNGVFGEFTTRYVFYFVTLMTLTGYFRLNKFLAWWTLFIALTAILALAGEFFWDPLGSYAITHGIMKDRLILNLSMVNNPNALAHSLAPGVAMLYYCMIWKRPLMLKPFGYVGITLVIYAIYLTFSKGGYIITAMTLVAIYTFGRPKYVQIAIVSIVISMGSVAVYSLPRMNELKTSKTDEAIQGRVASFRHAFSYYNRYTTGVGYGNFMKRQLSEYKLSKAPHSIYTAIGSQQGKPGMFIFLLIMWSCFRTLLFMRTTSVEQERARRILFALVFSYALSGWMVDFAYRPSFFLFVAAVSVLHRLTYIYEPAPEDELNENNAWMPDYKRYTAILPAKKQKVDIHPEHGNSVLTTPWKRGQITVEYTNSYADTPETESRKPSKKFDWIDIVATLVFMKIVAIAWVYFINNM
jgi:hypothetical protein